MKKQEERYSKMKKLNKLKESIYERQNKSEILEMQAAAKIYYSSIPFYDNIINIVGIIICLISVLLPEKWYFNTVLIVFNFVLVFCDNFIIRERNKAAKIREYIDAYLYDLRCDIDEEEIAELTLVQKKKNPELIELYCKNTGNDIPRGVRNWYSNYSGKDKWSEIVSCQKENLFFDKKICSKHLMKLVIYDVFVFVIFVILSLKTNILVAFLQLFEIIYKSYRKTLEVCKLNIFYTEVESYITGCKNKYKECDVIKIQKKINERRKMSIDISNSIHEKFSNEIHNDYKYITKKYTK